MINNRQGGRRRGRSGQRPQGMPGNSGGQRDNRNRGNAAQLLEKYKGLARDAQLAGDRVQTEYYLQFADHYFRVLEEHRARFEEQQPRRRRDEEDDEDEMMADGDEGAEVEDQPRRRQPREPRDAREGGRERSEGRAERAPRRSNGESRGDRQGEEESFFAALPPAIGADSGDDEEADAKPRRRTRRPRAETAIEEGDAAA